MNALDIARDMAKAGIPLFVARPAQDSAGQWDPAGGDGGTGYLFPAKWQQTEPDPSIIETWTEGDALCMVTGQGIDVLDTDPRSGGSDSRAALVAADLWPSNILGSTSTPSGGSHECVNAMGVASRDKVSPGVDVKAGTAKGTGRGFVFVPPTRRLSKVTGELSQYAWLTEPNLDELNADDPAVRPLAGHIQDMRASTVEGHAVPTAPKDARLVEQHRRYAQGAVKGIVGELAALDRPWHDGAGWDIATFGAAKDMVRLSGSPWCYLERAQAQRLFMDAAPRDAKWDERQTKWDRAVASVGHEARALPPQSTASWLDKMPDPSVTTALPTGGDTFWDERESLQHIRDFARARRTSPWAVLGVVLARVLATVPASVRLPPIVGGEASLNLFVALVAPSGGGKGAAEAAAMDAVRLPAQVDTVQTGSGEGLAHVFGRRVKGHVERHRYAAVVSIPEIDTVGAIGSRQGSTLLPTMRAAWSGEGLGNQNADATRTVPIERHTYRLSAIAGVQPEKSAALLDDADGGTPQRFVWLPATDPGAPDTAPPEPAPLVLTDQHWPASVLRLSVPKVAEEEIVAARLARMRGDGEALDGHMLLCQLKVSAALAVLDDRRTITADDWALAGRVMSKSLETRAACVATLQRVATEANHRRGRQDGMRQVAASEVIADDATKRVAGRVLAKVRQRPEWTRSDLRKSGTSADRAYFDQALERLVAAGQITVTETSRGTRISAIEVTP